MRLREDLEKLINEAINNDMTQCVVKVLDKGNDLEFAGIVEEGSNFASAYDMEAAYADRLDIEDPEVQFILAYHPGEVWDGKALYDEFEEPLNNFIDMEQYNKTRAAAQADYDKLNQNGTVPMGEEADFVLGKRFVFPGSKYEMEIFCKDGKITKCNINNISVGNTVNEPIIEPTALDDLNIDAKSAETIEEYLIRLAKRYDIPLSAEKLKNIVINKTDKMEEAQRKQLKLETNFDNGVSVSSDEAATNFVNLKFLELKDEKTAIENFKELLKLCRENKIPVKGRAKVKETLALYPEYKKSVEEYNKVVAELQDDWKKIVEEGIFTGFHDDERLNAAHEKRFKIEHLLYGTGALSKYNSMATNIERKLDDLKYNIAHPGEFGRTIWIGF